MLHLQECKNVFSTFKVFFENLMFFCNISKKFSVSGYSRLDLCSHKLLLFFQLSQFVGCAASLLLMTQRFNCRMFGWKIVTELARGLHWLHYNYIMIIMVKGIISSPSSPMVAVSRGQQGEEEEPSTADKEILTQQQQHIAGGKNNKMTCFSCNFVWSGDYDDIISLLDSAAAVPLLYSLQIINTLASCLFAHMLHFPSNDIYWEKNVMFPMLSD